MVSSSPEQRDHGAGHLGGDDLHHKEDGVLRLEMK
jgi:hypothetical protein